MNSRLKKLIFGGEKTLLSGLSQSPLAEGRIKNVCYSLKEEWGMSRVLDTIEGGCSVRRRIFFSILFFLVMGIVPVMAIEPSESSADDSAFSSVFALLLGGSGTVDLDDRNDIVMHDSFEADDWYLGWNLSSVPMNTSIIQDGTAKVGNGFLRMSIAEGAHYGSSFGYTFADAGLDEPDEVYFRYAIRLGPTWTTENGGGGKLPGFGGTYGVAGWGGKPSDGSNGWSARGLFWPPSQGQADGDTRIGYYCYHADMSGTYGDNWYWSGGNIGDEGVIKRNIWYQIEVYVKNNTPGVNDGILRAWVDGDQVFEKTDIRFRDITDLHVEKVWFDFYYGGTWTAPADMYLDFDDVVIAWNYIGESH
jgi:hypothetical protein